MLAPGKARSGTIGTKANYVSGALLLGFPSVFFLNIPTSHALAKLAGEKYSSQRIDPETNVTDQALNVQMVDTGASAGWLAEERLTGPPLKDITWWPPSFLGLSPYPAAPFRGHLTRPLTALGPDPVFPFPTELR